MVAAANAYPNDKHCLFFSGSCFLSGRIAVIIGIQTIPRLFRESKMNLAQLPVTVALFSLFVCR